MGGSIAPAPRLAKGGSFGISMLFLPGEGAKKDSRNSCGAGPQKRRPAFAMRGFSRALAPLHVAIKRHST
jgi:hypothetical protein